MSKLLSGKRVAVLVESQFIPEELRVYERRFREFGAEVHLVSRLWGEEAQTFVSEVEKQGEVPQTLDVRGDLERLNLDDYAAIIVAANYVSVRLRYFETRNGQSIVPSMSRQAPAVQLMSRAMRDRRIVKGLLCHGLWILTPVPEHLAGRKVICHEVVLSDVVNAGGIYTHSETGVVVDEDLVTGRSYHEAEAMADAIKDQILRLEQHRHSERPVAGFDLSRVRPKRRRILILLSEWGYWGEELVGPVEVFDAAGYEVHFITPTGQRPVAVAASMDLSYVDAPLRCLVTSEETAAKTREWDDPTTSQGERLENPYSLTDWFPERPYWSDPQFVRLFEIYNRHVAEARRRLTDYDALLIVGGSGPIVDLVNNQRVHDLILGFHAADKPIAAECYGVGCLAFARNIEDRKSLISGKHVTGHCLEYDYKDGTGFMKARGEPVDLNMGPPPYPLEYILRDATVPGGGFHGNFGKEMSVIVDYPFITGRSTPDSYLTGQKLVEVLDGDPPLRRFGW